MPLSYPNPNKIYKGDSEMKFQKGHIPWNKGKKGVQSNPNKGKTNLFKHSKETKRKMSESQKRRDKSTHISWNKGLTKETDERIKHHSEVMKGSPGGMLGKKASKETRKNQSKALKGKYLKEESSQWKGGCEQYWHEKAWELFGSGCCENCYMSNEEHKTRWKKRLEMHNTLEPKDYTIMELESWMTLCKECHAGLEAALENNKILYRKWDL